MIKRTLILLSLAALAVPATAAAERLDVQGPTAIAGKGFLRGELAMAAPADTKPVRFFGRAGFFRVVDLAGDLRLQCEGRGEAKSRTNEEGQKVFVCAGKGGRALVHGSHFRIAAVAGAYRMLVPAGVTGKLQGRFRTCTATAEPTADESAASDQRKPAHAGCGPQGTAHGDRPEQAADRREQTADRREQVKDRREQVKDRREQLKDRREQLKDQKQQRQDANDSSAADDEQD